MRIHCWKINESKPSFFPYRTIKTLKRITKFSVFQKGVINAITVVSGVADNLNVSVVFTFRARRNHGKLTETSAGAILYAILFFFLRNYFVPHQRTDQPPYT